MNKKGFTLVELLATLIVLAIVVGITIPLVLNSINKAKEKELRMLIKNIRASASNYVAECANMEDNTIGCANFNTNARKTIALSKLVQYGFLDNSDKCSDNSQYCIYDPVAETNIADCDVYIYDNGNYGYCAPAPGTNIPPNMCTMEEIENVPSKCWVLFTND